MIARVCVAIVGLLVIYGAAEKLKGRGMPTELAKPQMTIQEMPKKFGPWTGEDSTLDPEVFKAIGAKEAIDRIYRDKAGAEVTLHSAVFLEYGVQGVPHPPDICYPSAGYHINDSKVIDLIEGEPPDGKESKGTHPARLLTFEKDSRIVYCLYWYQFGDATVYDGGAQRKLILGFRGQTTWPPLIKVMLQTSANTPEEAQRRLLDLAAPAFAWTKGFH
jgi:EpsI family protein